MATRKAAPKEVTIPGSQQPVHQDKAGRQLRKMVDAYFDGEYSGLAIVAVRTDGSSRQAVHVDKGRGKMTDTLMLQSVVTLANSVGKLYPR